MLAVISKSDADLLVFPEYCYVPFEEEMVTSDIAILEDRERICQYFLDLSKEIG